MKNRLTTKFLTSLNISLLLSIIGLYVLLLFVIIFKVNISNLIESFNIEPQTSRKIIIYLNRIFWTLLDIIIPLFLISYLKWILKCRENINNIITQNKHLGISINDFKIKRYKKIIFFIFYPYLLMTSIFEEANTLISIEYIKREKELNQNLVDISWIILIFYAIFDTFFVIYMVRNYGLFSVQLSESSIYYYIIFLAILSILISLSLIVIILHYSKFEKQMLNVDKLT